MILAQGIIKEATYHSFDPEGHFCLELPLAEHLAKIDVDGCTMKQLTGLDKGRK